MGKQVGEIVLLKNVKHSSGNNYVIPSNKQTIAVTELNSLLSGLNLTGLTEAEIKAAKQSVFDFIAEKYGILQVVASEIKEIKIFGYSVSQTNLMFAGGGLLAGIILSKIFKKKRK